MAESRPWPQVENKDFGNATVVIIGAGIAGELWKQTICFPFVTNTEPVIGMCTAIDLIRKNKCRNFTILERGSGIGGTWNDKRSSNLMRKYTEQRSQVDGPRFQESCLEPGKCRVKDGTTMEPGPNQSYLAKR